MKDFSNILILTDLDGTFFGKHAKIIQRNIDAIEYFKAKGGRFSIATGRVDMSLTLTIPTVRELVNAPVIACNGAYMYDFQNNTPLCEHFLDYELTRRAIDFMYAAMPGVSIRLSVPEGYVTCPPLKPIMQRDFESCPPEKRHIIPLDEWEKFNWYKVVIRDSSEVLDSLREALVREMGDVFELSKSGPTFLEIQKKGCTKASMLSEMRKICKDSKHPGPLKIYAVGDYETDIAMLKAADVGVCPANALSVVKEVADLCLCSNEDGVIADLIEHIEAEN